MIKLSLVLGHLYFMRGINGEVIRFTKYQLTQGVKTIWYVFYVPTEFLLTGGVKGILFHPKTAQGTAWNTFLDS